MATSLGVRRVFGKSEGRQTVRYSGANSDITWFETILEDEVLHVHVRKNVVRGLKAEHSERLLPSLAVSLTASEELVAAGGCNKAASSSDRMCGRRSASQRSIWANYLGVSSVNVGTMPRSENVSEGRSSAKCKVGHVSLQVSVPLICVAVSRRVGQVCQMEDER